jgi:hypothetical protein
MGEAAERELKTRITSGPLYMDIDAAGRTKENLRHEILMALMTLRHDLETFPVPHSLTLFALRG